MSEKRLRILHLVNHVEQAGNGIFNVAVDLAVEQRRLGHDVAVASAGGAYSALLESHGVDHVHLPQAGGVQPARSLLSLAHHIRCEAVDIVHAHMMTGAALSRLATIGTPTRVVTTVHNSFQRHSILMRVGHRVIAVSEAVRQEMIGRGIPAAKIETVLNGTLGSARDDFGSEQLPIKMKRPAILTIAGMYHRKGIGDLIEAVSLLRNRIPEVVLYLAGDGPNRPEFEARTHNLSDSFVFLGFRRDVRVLLAQADVFVLASHADPNPLVISEARLAGVPVIATCVDGIPEALDGGKAGVLVPPHDPKALAEALSSVLVDKSLAERLCQAGLRNLDNLHVKRVCQQTLDVYKKALAQV